MEDQLISFETAKLAKEKGFAIGSKFYYGGHGWNVGDLVQSGITTCINGTNGYFEGVCEAPTQSLLQKWLREKYNLHIEVKVQDFVQDPIYYWSIFGSRIVGFAEGLLRCKLNSSETTVKEYKTYEEALEVALLESLKLINL